MRQTRISLCNDNDDNSVDNFNVHSQIENINFFN